MNRRTSVVNRESSKSENDPRLDERGRSQPKIGSVARSSDLADALPGLTYHIKGRVATVTQCLRCGLTLFGDDACPRCEPRADTCSRCGNRFYYRDQDGDACCLMCGDVLIEPLTLVEPTKSCACGRAVRRQQADVCNACYMRARRAVAS